MGVDVGRPGIDYRERSPLVIPPTLDLPPPQAADAVGAQSGLAARAGAQEDRGASQPNARATAEDPGTSSALTPDELRRGTNPRAAARHRSVARPARSDEADIGRPLRPDELRQRRASSAGAP